MENKIFESKNKLQMKGLFSAKGHLLQKLQQNT